jgi:tetratricopeptide (TPR) repeat protein
MIALIGYWLAPEAQEKKKLTAECWTLTKDCLEALEKSSDACEYGRTYNQLSTCIDLGFFFEWDFKARKRMIGEAIDYGERTIKLLSTLGDSVELARAYVKTANCLEVFGHYFVDLGESENYYQKAKDYLQKANEISEEAAMLEVPTVLFGAGPGGYWGDGTDSALNNLAKTLDYSRKTRDKFIIGCTLDLMKYHTLWLSTTYDDRDERLKHFEKAMQYVEEAKRQFCLISFISPRGGGLWVEGPYAQFHYMSSMSETNLSEKRGFLEKGLRVAPEELKRAESSGYPEIIFFQHWMYGALLAELAKIARDSEEKRGLLEKALVHMDKFYRISEQVEQLSSWNVNLGRNDFAVTKSKLADLVKDHETRKAMLQEAIIDMETSSKFCIKSAIFSYEKEGTVALFSHVGPMQSDLGDLWIRVHKVSQNNEHLQRAIEALDDAAESYEKFGRKSRVAECLWKAARVYDDLGNHLKASEKFEAASGNYRVAAEKIPKLNGFYGDHAIYMHAWSEIEKARYHHARQEYGMAKEHFEKAAELHKSLKQWNYLEPNYSAWTRVEDAEELSRKEQGEEARKAFECASKLFTETRKSVQVRLSKIEDNDEKQMATDIIKASDLRKEYCEGRITLEEAKILDKKGEHYSSSEKYGSAADAFEKMSQKSESEQDRKELRLIVSLSNAWQKMTLAEAKSSPGLYLEASRIFEEAEDLSPNEKTKMLLLGHSRFCKALEAGTRFADSGDTMLHQIAEQHLESAAKYYVRAGFQSASEYSKAMEYLFDAYLYMDDAKREKDPEKKARLYIMAEKVLQTSAGSFTKAEHPEKREQVSKLLDKAREQKELALSLSEVLHAPSIVSTTTAFTAPTPTSEEAVGSERFEHADIQGNLIIRQKELKVGELLNLEIELVNAGKGPALLIKVNQVIPEGFELSEKPETCRVEDSYIDMKGKRLGPLKTEELRLVLKPKVQGTFALKPTILYLDENGKYKSHELETVTIMVKELGLKGWIKGER